MGLEELSPGKGTVVLSTGTALGSCQLLLLHLSFLLFLPRHQGRAAESPGSSTELRVHFLPPVPPSCAILCTPVSSVKWR